MAEGRGKAPPKSGGPEKKSGGGFWSFVGDLLGGLEAEISVGKPGRAAPSCDPSNPAERMQPVRDERKEAYEETIYRKTEGAEGTAPAVRVDRDRQTIARSLDGRMKAQSASPVPTGAGAPLPREVRAKMEPRLGADLSNVRMHTAGDSAAKAQELGARAFTVGDDVHFNAGEFRPDTKEGDKLLAHELTHVVQGQKSGIQRKADRPAGDEAGEAVSDPAEPAEKEADAVADRVGDDLQGGGDKEGNTAEPGANGAHKPAPIAAKLGGVGRKIFRNVDDKKGGKPKVDKPVPGLFGQLDPLSTPPGWHFTDTWQPTDKKQPNLVVLRTDVVDPQGKAGFVERGYDTAKKQFVMLNAFLIEPGADKGTGVQNMIEHKDPVMIQGRGTPTQTFLTLRQMKMLEKKAGMDAASLEKVKMSTIQNIEGICQLHQALESGAKPEELMANNESRRYAETTLTQIGKKIKSAKVIGGMKTPFKQLLDHYERGDAKKRQNFDKLLQQYKITRDTVVLWNYDIEFELMPFDGGKS